MSIKPYYESFESLCSFVSDGKVVISGDDIKHGKRMNEFVDLLTPAKKEFAKAILELNARFRLLDRYKLKYSTDIYDLLKDKLGGEEVEHFYLISLNQDARVIGVDEISRGGIDQVSVDVRIIIKTALMHNATQIAVAHNHPSGNVMPSNIDEKITENIRKACEIMNLRLMDHVIVTNKEYYSFHDNGKV